jgi:hypothetical protein
VNTLLDFTEAPTVWDFMQDDSRVRVIIGPVGSGKTVGCCAEVMRRALMQEPSPHDNIRRFKAGIVRNTMPELWRTTMETWLSTYPENEVGPLHRTAPVNHLIEVAPNLDTGEPGLRLHVDFFGLDKDKDVKSLLSYEGTMIWFNEIREIPKKLVDAATDRVGRYPSKAKGNIMPTWHGVVGDTNPPDEDHWIYKFAGDDPQRGYTFFHQPPGVLEAKNVEEGEYKSIDAYNHRLVVTEENRVLRSANTFWIANPDAENLSNLPLEKKDDDPLGQGGYYLGRCAGKDRDWIRGYYQGYFGPIFEGRPVIPGFTREFMVVDGLELLPDAPIIGGIDIGGGTLSPAAVMGQKHPRGVYLIHAEVSPPDEGQGLVEFVDDMKTVFAARFPRGSWGRFYGDPAGQTRDPLFKYTMFSHLMVNGIKAYPTATNDPRDRIEAIKSPMGRMIDGKPGILIDSRCTMLIRGLLGGWKFRRIQASGEDRYSDAPSKNKYSHVCDALGYMLQGGGEGKALRTGKPRVYTQSVVAGGMDFKVV